MGWLHSKGEVITLLIYIESESGLRLPLKESFSAFFCFRTQTGLCLWQNAHAAIICTMQIPSIRVFTALSFIF